LRLPLLTTAICYSCDPFRVFVRGTRDGLFSCLFLRFFIFAFFYPKRPPRFPVCLAAGPSPLAVPSHATFSWRLSRHCRKLFSLPPHGVNRSSRPCTPTRGFDCCKFFQLFFFTLLRVGRFGPPSWIKVDFRLTPSSSTVPCLFFSQLSTLWTFSPFLLLP